MKHRHMTGKRPKLVSKTLMLSELLSGMNQQGTAPDMLSGIASR